MDNVGSGWHVWSCWAAKMIQKGRDPSQGPCFVPHPNTLKFALFRGWNMYTSPQHDHSFMTAPNPSKFNVEYEILLLIVPWVSRFIQHPVNWNPMEDFPLTNCNKSQLNNKHFPPIHPKTPWGSDQSSIKLRMFMLLRLWEIHWEGGGTRWGYLKMILNGQREQNVQLLLGKSL